MPIKLFASDAGRGRNIGEERISTILHLLNQVFQPLAVGFFILFIRQQVEKMKTKIREPILSIIIQ